MIKSQKKPTARRSAWRRPEKTTLRFSPTAWSKLIYLRDRGDTEVGGFGIAAEDDLLYVTNVQLVRQICTAVTVAFDDESVADFFDRQVDAGLELSQFGRIWVHTHPGNSARPSQTDEATFARVFGRSHWAVMFILAEEGETYARLRFSVGPGGDCQLPVEIDFAGEFAGSDHQAWDAEYLANVEVPLPAQDRFDRASKFDAEFLVDDVPEAWREGWLDYVRLHEQEEVLDHGQ